MNYDKQKALTQEEINYINSKNNLCIVNLCNYKEGYIHTEIAWDLPIDIIRNQDEFYWKTAEFIDECNKENYWVVFSNYYSEKEFNFQIKQFKDIDKALKYAITEYKKWLKNRLKYVESYNI